MLLALLFVAENFYTRARAPCKKDTGWRVAQPDKLQPEVVGLETCSLELTSLSSRCFYFSRRSAENFKSSVSRIEL